MSRVVYAGNKGLTNLGNTCYMNSALQCLSHLLIFHPLNEKFHSECKELNDCLMKEWFEFQRKIWSNNNLGTINTMSLIRYFQKGCNDNNIYFQNFNQNDIDEFLVYFLELLHKCIKKEMSFNQQIKVVDDGDKIIQKSYDTWKRFYENDYSYIVSNFHSQLLSITSCPECNYCTTNHEPIQVISLEIPEDAETFYDCLDKYTTMFELDTDNSWKCDECGKKVNSNKKIMLWKSSDVLIFTLKRFTKRKKIDRHIRYPMQLNMKKYNLNFGTNSSNIYNLQSLGIHSGGLGGGHYYAVCKNHLDKSWREYNDSSVNTIDEKQILSYDPYLLIYKRN